MTRGVATCSLLALLAAGGSTLAAGPPEGAATPGEARRVVVPALAAPPVIDGTLAEGEWSAAVRLDSFTQLLPDEGLPVSEATEMWLGYDHDNLYLAARCHDSDPAGIVGNIATRDGDLTYDDAVEIILDTFLDRQSGFLFKVNPAGARFDATVRREGEEINSDWDGLWSAVATRDAGGWSVEMAIPFKTLRFPTEQTQTWGVNLGRFIARKREEAYWQPMARSYGFYAAYKISQFGTLSGLEGVEQGGERYRITPYAIAGYRDATEETGRILDAGLDAKIQLTPNLIADLTYNTDFAETEADEQQINLTRFKLFFPEKRAFFLEGADLFYFGERPEPYKAAETALFFSRQIGLTEDGGREIPVLGGIKMTGKTAGVGLGVLSITTDRTTYTAPDGGRVTEPQTNYSVLRLKRDVLGGSTVGVMALNKAVAGADDNRALGADWDFTLAGNLKIGGFVARTDTPGLGSDTWGYAGDLFWDSKQWRARVAYTDLGDDFNPEMGFLTRTGIKKVRTNLTRIFWPEGGRVQQWFVLHALDYITDQSGQIESRVNNLELSVINRNSSGIALKAYDQLEVLTQPFPIHPGVVIQPGAYRFDYLFFGFQTDYSKPLGMAGRLQAGEFYDGDLLQTFAAVIYRPTPGLFSAVSYERNDASLSAGDFTTELATAEVNYTFASGLTTRGTVQWNRDDNVQTKLILRWPYRPGSDLYLVYDDTQDLRPLDRFSGPPFDSRRILAKITYLFDF